MLLKIAIRNTVRNGRRSLMTASAIAVGAAALILFGEYRGMAVIGLETGYVQAMGHLTVFRKGYSDFGAGRPDAYAISGYRPLIALIRRELGPLANVVTPTVSLGGIAGNAANDTSTTFFGTGVMPSDRDRMRRWDEYGLYTTARYKPYPLRDAEIDRGIVGRGLARVLGLCRSRTACSVKSASRLDLLGGAGGAPNVVAFHVDAAQSQGTKELDDHYAGMHLVLAQRLLYGGGEPKVSAIVIQLKRSEDLALAKARLQALLADHDLELRDFKELSPTYSQIIAAQLALFAFVSVVLFLIVLFTIANTMGMSVMERVNEIGTARAMGVRRGGIRWQFLAEGAALGVIGATAGTLAAVIATFAINHAGITYHMPISTDPIPLYLMDEGVAGLRFAVWLALVAMAVLASLLPANLAARLPIVDALRHV